MNMWLRVIAVLIRSRLRGKLDPLGPCRTPFRVRFSDLDALGHMNNGVYFSIFDLGRVELMLRSGMYQRFKKQGWFAVVSAETGSFRRELKPLRRFVVETRIMGWDERAVYAEHRIISGGKLATSAVVQLRFLSRSGERIEPQRLMDLMPGEISRPDLPAWVSDWSKSVYEHARASELTRS